MERYYKIGKNSVTGKKLIELIDKVNEFQKLQGLFLEKYNIKYTYNLQCYVSDLSDIVFNVTPNDVKDNWKRGAFKNSYTLKVRPKNTDLKREWDEIREQRIRRDEFDRIIGCRRIIPDYSGMDFTPCDYILVITDHPDVYDFPKDVIEITNVEYLKLLHPDDVWPDNIKLSVPTDMEVKGLN